jgi:hypothetical protein
MADPTHTIIGSDTVKSALLTKTQGNIDNVYDDVNPASAKSSYDDVNARLDAMDTAINAAGSAGAAMVVPRTDAARLAASSPTVGSLCPTTDSGLCWWYDSGGWNELADCHHTQTIGGTKSFSSPITFSSGVTVTGVLTASGGVTGDVTGDVAGTLTDSSVTGGRVAAWSYDKALTHVLLGRNYIDGLTLSNDTDADHDISVAAGACANTGYNLIMENDSAFVKRIDASWAAGTGNGGFPTGLSLSADTWYLYFMIAKTDGTVDFGFDTSSTAANLLADATGYSYYRRIGFVLTDGSSNILGFTQFGDWYIWDVPYHVADASPTASDAGESYTLGPPVETLALVNTVMQISSDIIGLVYVRSPGSTDDSPTYSAVPGYTAGINVNTDATESSIGASGTGIFKTNSSGEVKASVDDANVNIYFNVVGYIDLRGKE